MTALTSTTRLPVDHLISGALIGAIAAGGANFISYKEGKTDKNLAIKKTAKLALQGGIATACAISASNKLVSKSYFGAAATIALGLAGIIASEKFINLEESK